MLVTDAEIDHTAGLLLLRESPVPVRIFGGAEVQRALSDTILRMLERFCGVDWHILEPGHTRALEGSSLTVEAIGPGLVFSDAVTGGVLTYAPAVAGFDEGLLSRLGASDLVLVDGTFWLDDELAPPRHLFAQRARTWGT